MNKALDRILVTEETATKIKEWATENKYFREDGYLSHRTARKFANQELPILEAQYEWTSISKKESAPAGIVIGKKISQILYFKITNNETISGTSTIKIEGQEFEDDILKYEFNIFDEEFIYFENKGVQSSNEGIKASLKVLLSGVIATLIFMSEFREVKEVVSESRVTYINPNRKKDKNRNRKVVKIGVYHINPNFQAALEKRKFERRTEAWGVRGHWRTYKKTGKRVWVKEHKKGQGEKEGKTYQA